MNCEMYQERMSAWIDGELSASDQEQLMAHLKDCTACSAVRDEWLSQSDALRNLARSLYPTPLEPSVPVQAWISDRRKHQFTGIRLVGALCVVLSILLTIAALSSPLGVAAVATARLLSPLVHLLPGLSGLGTVGMWWVSGLTAGFIVSVIGLLTILHPIPARRTRRYSL